MLASLESNVPVTDNFFVRYQINELTRLSTLQPYNFTTLQLYNLTTFQPYNFTSLAAADSWSIKNDKKLLKGTINQKQKQKWQRVDQITIFKYIQK